MLNIGDRYTNKFGEQFEIIKKNKRKIYFKQRCSFSIR